MQHKEKSLSEIKRDVALITLDIENLDPGKKVAAIIHLKETIDILQLGTKKRFKEDPEDKESPEKKIKLDPKQEFSDKDWMIMSKVEEATKTDDNDEEIISFTKFLYRGMIPTCQICSSTFITVGALDSHMKANHADIKQEKTFINELENVEEIVNELEPAKTIDLVADENAASVSVQTSLEMDDSGFYNCHETGCVSRFTNKKSLKNHFNIHTDRFKCSGCQQPFMSNFFLKSHKKNPINCEKILRIREKLRQNKVFEATKLLNEMNEEGKGEDMSESKRIEENLDATVSEDLNADNSLMTESEFVSGYSSSYHEQLELQIQEGKATISANSEEQSNNEYTMDSNSKSDVTFTCGNCGKEYNNRSSYIDHDCKTVKVRRSVNEILKCENGTYKCKDCGKTYSKRSSYLIHLNIHTDRFKCYEECQQRFSSGFKLKNHDCQRIMLGLSVSDLNVLVASGLHESDTITCGYPPEKTDGDDEDDFDMLKCEACDKYFVREESLENHKSLCGEQAKGDVNTGIVENKRTPDPEDEDVLILQQSYPDITFTPKIKVEL